MVSPFFLSEFKYVFGRIAEGSRAGVRKIYLVKRCNYYNEILDFFVQNGYIKGFHQFNELLVIYFGATPRGILGVNFALRRVQTIRWVNRRHSLTVKDLKRLQRKMAGSSLILSTDAGILTLDGALHRHVGGYPLFRIY